MRFGTRNSRQQGPFTLAPPAEAPTHGTPDANPSNGSQGDQAGSVSPATQEPPAQEPQRHHVTIIVPVVLVGFIALLALLSAFIWWRRRSRRSQGSQAGSRPAELASSHGKRRALVGTGTSSCSATWRQVRPHRITSALACTRTTLPQRCGRARCTVRR